MDLQKEKMVTVESLMEEISVLVKDEIVAKFEQAEGKLKIHLHNGQSFQLELQEL